MTYLLQITTSDQTLQLRTERTANTIAQLQAEGSKMVSQHPEVKGLPYMVGFYKKDSSGTSQWTSLKNGIIGE